MLKRMKWATFAAVLLVAGLCAAAAGSGVDRQDPGADAGLSGEPPRPESPQPELVLAPDAIPIGLLFSGGRVFVRGTLPAGCDPALIVRGQDQEATMSIRGKRLGLWMAVGTATFEKAPALYQCLTASPLEEIASADTMRENEVGFEPIEDGMEVTLDGEESEAEGGDSDWKAEFVAFKAASGLYSVQADALRVTPGEGGMETIEGEIVLPARSPEGRCRVTLLGFRDGTLVARVEAGLTVRLVGAVAFLRNLAMEHGWTYGIVAVIVALGAGFGVGFLVPSKGSH